MHYATLCTKLIKSVAKHFEKINGVFCVNLQLSIEELKTRENDLINRITEQSTKLETENVTKTQKAQTLQEFLLQAENDACALSPNATADQLNQVKVVFKKYLEDYYTLHHRGASARSKQTDDQILDQGVKLYGLFIDNAAIY